MEILLLSLVVALMCSLIGNYILYVLWRGRQLVVAGFKEELEGLETVVVAAVAAGKARHAKYEKERDLLVQ